MVAAKAQLLLAACALLACSSFCAALPSPANRRLLKGYGYNPTTTEGYGGGSYGGSGSGYTAYGNNGAYKYGDDKKYDGGKYDYKASGNKAWENGGIHCIKKL
ncbi:hypothetical protein DUNSADRAFT_9914 [Dunaliella salina]|uniref:Uncharacterized protein n=1 Tax=Dunaliella salina TaxID=3046 RepID=A0ABQ7GGJ1_DUNSA|nr:hypothetical protein DUNSADRAFT_9914 [Dunaliella salina]|eukprot:KAF5833716.1 hypothetical protein DUNSADRAFT_9914 [Dunaliella salina]